MTKDEMKEYQHAYWLKVKNDPERHADLLKRRKMYYKHSVLRK